ncbi:MAG: hypothetical protein Q8M20_17610 [Rhodocyclaceae bacterium]|nr:hypothetical protein [Rhodocyclaceae bacterium]MDZ4215833.1 PhaM family polyhydroxyalkanoate granule multifunctional regulatory protein [Rhodocyclaceae bacterium]
MTNAPPPFNHADPMEFMKNMWGNMGFALPGMVTPTVDTDELGKRITDLKAVEGWLKSNLSLLQMTIQGLEMQRTTLMALQQMSQATQSAGEGDAASNPFLNPANWQMPWNMMGGAVPPAPTSDEAPAAGTSSGNEPSQPKG